MYAQALSLMSRVYVGSISFEIREDMLRKTFEAFGPIKSLNMGFDNVTGVRYLYFKKKHHFLKFLLDYSMVFLGELRKSKRNIFGNLLN